MKSIKYQKVLKCSIAMQYVAIFIACTSILVYESSILIRRYIEKKTGTGKVDSISKKYQQHTAGISH